METAPQPLARGRYRAQGLLDLLPRGHHQVVNAVVHGGHVQRFVRIAAALPVRHDVQHDPAELAPGIRQHLSHVLQHWAALGEDRVLNLVGLQSE